MLEHGQALVVVVLVEGDVVVLVVVVLVEEILMDFVMHRLSPMVFL